MKKQIIFIDGGSTFKSDKDFLLFLDNLKIDLNRYRRSKWKDSLRNELGENFDILLPKMPSHMNAKYNEWKMFFGKIAPLLDDNTILIGHSLGATFLVKYLSENVFPKKILATFLVAPPHDTDGMDDRLKDFDPTRDFATFAKQAGKIFIYASKDDPSVPYSNTIKYKKTLPDAIFREFEDRQHFNQPTFPEIIEDIKIFSE